MTAEAPRPPTTLPTAAVELLDDLDRQELQAAIDYAQQRLKHESPTTTQQIKAQTGEEIVHIRDGDGYKEVVKREPCGVDCGDCPHPMRYHVIEEKQTDGSVKLHWVYLGRIME